MTIEELALYKSTQVNNENAAEMMSLLKERFIKDLERNQVPGMNVDTLNTRQRNAIYNWISVRFDDRTKQLAKERRAFKKIAGESTVEKKSFKRLFSRAG